MKFKGTIIITDPCYIIKDNTDVWDGHTPVEAANRLYEFCLHYSNPI